MLDFIITVIRPVILPYLSFFGILIFGAVILAAIKIGIDGIGYKDSTYHNLSKKNFISVRLDLGAYGEYLIYKKLREYEKSGSKFLFNIYVPKENGETTEIDAVMIDKKGIFVFESKNYSGWIFGKEEQSYWTQTLPGGRGKSTKKRFFNPVLQNRSHIKHLKNILSEDIPMFSVVAFSDRCELKNITVSPETVVVNRRDVLDVTEKEKNRSADALSDDEMISIYEKLYPFTQVSSEVKEKHIQALKKKNEKTVLPPQPSNDGQKSVCPKCCGELVLRTAKRGENAGKQFYGCSNFPRCRYVRNI